MKPGPLNLKALDKDYVVIVQLMTQAKGVIHQVALRPEKILGEYIRLGETPGDEAAGWQHYSFVLVLSVIGTLHKTETGWETRPLQKLKVAPPWEPSDEAKKDLETGETCKDCGKPMFKSKYGHDDYCKTTKCYYGTDDEAKILAAVCPGM